MELAVWWVIGLLLWSATISPVTVEELVPAALCALACALAALACRHAVGARWRMRAHWFTWATSLPVAVVLDTARLAGRSWGRPAARGVVRHATLAAEADSAVTTTHRALAATALSATPGSVVLDIDGDELQLHTLTPGPSRLEKAVRR